MRLVVKCDVPERGFIPAIAKGTVVYSYDGCTYGCVDYDKCEAVTFDEDGRQAFFEIPRDALTEAPMGAGGHEG